MDFLEERLKGSEARIEASMEVIVIERHLNEMRKVLRKCLEEEYESFTT